MGASVTSLSDNDDEEAEKLRSVAIDSASVSGAAALLTQKKRREKDGSNGSDRHDAAPALQHYQYRARDLLHKYLDSAFEIIPAKDTCTSALDMPESGFYLFKNAPSGLSEKQHYQEAALRKRSFHDRDVNEASDMFQSHLVAAAIDGVAVRLHADRYKAKALALWTLQETEEKAAKQEDDERVALLKRQRGELWLPSIARHMQGHHVSDAKPLSSVTFICPPMRAEVKVPHFLSESYTNGQLKMKKKKLASKEHQRFKTCAVTKTI
ncbi:hypothetical protein L7F22_045358 [Adiantum nelumboides]|nr:hypothetical protein [Adiantum nelumboides]